MTRNRNRNGCHKPKPKVYASIDDEPKFIDLPTSDEDEDLDVVPNGNAEHSVKNAKVKANGKAEEVKVKANGKADEVKEGKGKENGKADEAKEVKGKANGKAEEAKVKASGKAEEAREVKPNGKAADAKGVNANGSLSEAGKCTNEALQKNTRSQKNVSDAKLPKATPAQSNKPTDCTRAAEKVSPKDTKAQNDVQAKQPTSPKDGNMAADSNSKAGVQVKRGQEAPPKRGAVASSQRATKPVDLYTKAQSSSSTPAKEGDSKAKDMGESGKGQGGQKCGPGKGQGDQKLDSKKEQADQTRDSEKEQTDQKCDSGKEQSEQTCNSGKEQGDKKPETRSKPDPKEKAGRKPQGDCVVCGHLAKNFCSSCKNVFYCNRDHQRAHWNAHKEDCKTMGKLPYRVERNSTLGRHLVATRDLPAGTLILNELPMLIGPRQLSKPVCLGCHKELEDSKRVKTCSRCHWPLCSTKCEDSPLHDPECRILRYGGTKVQVTNFGQINMMYASIAVLRALALKEGPQKIWNEYTMFESHLEERMKTEVYTKVNKEKVVFFIQHYLRLLNKYSDLEILESCGKLDTNSFEIRQNGLNLRAMFRTACLISHDCKPNTKHTFSPDDNAINVYATVDIAAGTVISATYTQPLWSTLARRDHLFSSKCFWCQCDRCKDPREFGALLSCLNCSQCGGQVLSSEPLEAEAEWRCQSCSHTLPAADVRKLTARLTSELKSLDRTSPDELERFMINKSTLLPDTHQLIREIQYGLVCLFKNQPTESMTNAQLLRKSVLCKQLLELSNTIDPGLSRWRGQLLFEMQASAVVLAQRALEEDRIKPYQAKEIFEENSGHLQEAVQILQVEPEGKEELQKQMKNLSKILSSIDDDEDD